jgi:hypothetical protein
VLSSAIGPRSVKPRPVGFAGGRGGIDDEVLSEHEGEQLVLNQLRHDVADERGRLGFAPVLVHDVEVSVSPTRWTFSIGPVV